MTQATTLKQLDEVVVSATVVLSSPSSGENVEKHFQNLQTLLTSTEQPVINDSNITEEDFVVGYPPENFRFASLVFQCWVLSKFLVIYVGLFFSVFEGSF